MPYITGRNADNRLAVLVFGFQIKCNRFLEIPKLWTRKARKQTEEVY